MKRIFSILFAVVLVLSFSLIPAAPAMATGTTTTLSIPDNVYRPAPFDVSGTTTNDGTAYTNVRFNITVSGPEAFTGAREDIFTITQVVPGGVQGINETFVLVDGDFVGYWGPEGGFPLPAPYGPITSTFTIQMNDGGTAPVGNYQVTVELDDLNNGVLATATAGFCLSADTLYVGAGQQFTTIQSAVDAASPGDVVIVHAGTYNQSVVFGPEDSGITLRGESGAILNGTGLATVDGIRLLAGVSGVTIEGFEICNYTGTGNGQGNAIQAWNSGTSDITIKNNEMHHNSWSAILVGNEGTGLHTGWRVRNNNIYNNGVYSLELTNAQDSEIRGNTVSGGVIGIVVQARNTIPDSGMVTVTDVRVMRNTVSGATYNVYIMALASGPIDPFPPIIGAQATLEDVMFTGNEVTDGLFGVLVWGYEGGQVNNARIVRNTFSGLNYGVYIVTQVTNAKIVKNTFTDCATDVIDGGEDTKIPPYGSP